MFKKILFSPIVFILASIVASILAVLVTIACALIPFLSVYFYMGDRFKSYVKSQEENENQFINKVMWWR
jgi:uncharacterized protein YxeA